MKRTTTLLFFLIFTHAFSQVVVKNTGSSKIFVAIGYYEKSNWTTKGWFAIEPNQEQNVYNPKLFGNDTFYYCATIENCDMGYFGNTDLYVDKKNAFTISNADNTQNYSNPNISKYKFIKVNLNTLDKTEIIVEPNNLTCYGKRVGKWKLGLDKEGDFAELKEDIRYYREVNFDNDSPKGWCKDYYADGPLKAEFKLSSFKPFKYDGKCTWYSKDGMIEKEAVYINGIASSETVSNNGALTTKKAVYEIVKLPIQNIYLNSTSNAFWKNGNTKSIIPVDLPEGTVEWYYEFTSSRSKELIQANVEKFQLAAELSSLIDKSGLLSASINVFTTPPGNDVCDIYLFENNYYNQFLNEQQFNHFPVGTRQNYKSGVVQIRNLPLKKPMIGIQNKDMMYGINVSIQIIAVVSKI